MLAAAPSEERRVLDLFELALKLVSEGAHEVPRELVLYFDQVLAQARSLAKDPRAPIAHLTPAAIQLALDLRRVADLKTAIDDVQGLAEIKPDRAGLILSKLEHSVAAEG